jgi:hypothetical protein
MLYAICLQPNPINILVSVSSAGWDMGAQSSC